jgi:drug/metabolite transporter (DMT)-like permease
VNRRAAAEAALVGNTIVWGATFVLVKAMLRDVSPLLLLALRFSLAATLLLALFHRKLRLEWRYLQPGILAGVFLFSGYALQTAGLRYTTAPKAAFLTGLASVLVPLVGSLVYRNRPLVSEVLGVLVATSGLALMTLEGDIGSVNRGDLLTFGCALAFAAHIVVVGHYARLADFEQLAIVQIVTAALLSLSLFRWAEQSYVEWRPTLFYGILITGVLATALAFTIQAWAQQYTTPTRTALIYMLEPVVAWMTSFFLAGEGLSTRASLGAGCILGGILLVELKPLNAKKLQQPVPGDEL